MTKPIDETWHISPGGNLVFPDGKVDLHVDGEPDQIVTETSVYLYCEGRATIAQCAPEALRMLQGMEWNKHRCTHCYGNEPNSRESGGFRGHRSWCRWLQLMCKAGLRPAEVEPVHSVKIDTKARSPLEVLQDPPVFRSINVGNAFDNIGRCESDPPGIVRLRRSRRKATTRYLFVLGVIFTLALVVLLR